MANPKIEVEIGAKVEGLSAGVNQATSQLDKLGKSAQATAPQIQKLTQATAAYNSIGIDFARIIQDAPFGIIGVGNNITQLAQSFQVLKNQTGSTSSAIKTAFSTIFSSGNLLILGISALTTVFTILQQKGFFKTEESVKSLDDRLKEYQDTLSGVAASTLKGAQDAQKELAVLKSLEIQATNTSVSTEKRLNAVEKLQKLYPDYFGNLTKEQILNGDVGDAYLKVAESLLVKAKAQAATNQLAENGIELLRIESKLEDARTKRLLEVADAEAQIDALRQQRQKEGFLNQGDLQRYDRLIKSINTANESLKEEEDLKKEIAKINKENDLLTSEITKQIQAGASFTNDSADAKDREKKALDAYSKAWDSYNLSQETAKIGTENLSLAQNALNKKIEETLKILPTQPVKIDVDGSPLSSILSTIGQIINTTPSANKALENLGKTEVKVGDQPPVLEIPQIDNSKKSAFIKSLKDFNAEATAIVSSGTANTIGDIAFGIGQALANGTSVFKAAGRALLEGVAQIADGLGQAAIKVGIGMIAIKAAFKNPATAIAAGVALVALAGFIRAKIGGGGGSSIPSGGGGGSASVGGSGVGGGASFVGGAQGGLFQQNRDVSGEFVVRGQDLVYVLGQANNRINKG